MDDSIKIGLVVHEFPSQYYKRDLKQLKTQHNLYIYLNYTPLHTYILYLNVTVLGSEYMYSYINSVYIHFFKKLNISLNTIIISNGFFGKGL